MTLLPDIQEKVNTALRAGLSDQVSAWRMLLAELKNAQIAKGGDLTEADIFTLTQKEIKKRKEAATIYTAQQETARAQQELTEAEIYSSILPEAVSESELLAYLQAERTKITESGPAVRGILIKKGLAQFGARTDGQTVSRLAASLE